MKNIFTLINISLILWSCQSCMTGDLNYYNYPDVLFSNNNDSIDDILINIPPVEFCGQDHYHFVDIIAKYKIDSLNETGIDTILFYRHWLGTNGFNGYGKILWKEGNSTRQMQLNFENYNGRYGISSIDLKTDLNPQSIDFFFSHQLDTVQSSPREPKISISHDADHFVYAFVRRFALNDQTCFHVSGLNIWEDSLHLKSQLIRYLTINPYDYIELLETRRK